MEDLLGGIVDGLEHCMEDFLDGGVEAWKEVAW